MAFYIYDEKKTKVVEVTKERLNARRSKLGTYINMRKTWSGQTKVEFSETSMEDSINEMNK